MASGDDDNIYAGIASNRRALTGSTVTGNDYRPVFLLVASAMHAREAVSDLVGIVSAATITRRFGLLLHCRPQLTGAFPASSARMKERETSSEVDR